MSIHYWEKPVIKGASHLCAGEEAVQLALLVPCVIMTSSPATHRGHGHAHAHGDSAPPKLHKKSRIITIK